MKPETILKYLSYIYSQKNQEEEGFTLIELLVVVIIIGILAAVALPNLLGQVGKARETEAKNAVGTVNRAQQAYHYLNGIFSDDYTNTELQSSNALDIVIPQSKYYSFSITSAGSNTLATITAQGIDSGGNLDNGKAQGTRDYTGGTAFNGAGQYATIICQADIPGDPNATTITLANIGFGGVDNSCADGDTKIK